METKSPLSVVRPNSAPQSCCNTRFRKSLNKRVRPKSSCGLNVIHEREESCLDAELPELTPSGSRITTPRSQQEDSSSSYSFGSDESRKRFARQKTRSRRRLRDSSLSSNNNEDETPDERRARLQYLFKKAARVVRRVAQMAICMIRLSKQNTTSTLVAQLHYFSADGNTSQSLAFDKAKFRRSNLFLPLWARQVGVKAPHERTPEEIYRLYSVMKNMKSFEKFTQKIRLQICKMARYTCCEKGRVIVRQGHIGYNFYFIYAGSVFVQLEMTDSRTGAVTANTMNVIGKGQSFGELALLGDGKRTASIICREPTELFEIEKDTFLEICPDMFEREMEDKLAVAKKQSLFRNWPDGNLQRLCFESQIQEVPHSKIVDKDTSNSPYLYFVLKGKILMLRQFNILQAAGKTDYNLMVYKDRPLPPPEFQDKSANGRRRAINNADKCFCSIGYLQDGECSDLSSIRHAERGDVPGLILISQGVQVMRVVKRRLESLAPRGSIEAFKKTYEPHIWVPSDEDLYRKYVEDATWRQFRGKLVNTLMDEKGGGFLCHRPVTSKGSSGWAKWPGVGKMNARCRLYQGACSQRTISTAPSTSMLPSQDNRKGQGKLLHRPKTAPSVVQTLS
ncbi:cyclic nucleotide-binding domain-containing protein 2-like [Glandiceps talaboti]